MPTCTVDISFGLLTLTQTGDALTAVDWGRARQEDETDLLRAAAAQLVDYAAGMRTTFDIPLDVQGSALQKAVCAAMLRIPFGETTTYGEIAKEVGASAQAVGQACGGNPMPIVIPCHRVMGAGGKLTGFSGAGGVETKVALLRHEGAASLLI